MPTPLRKASSSTRADRARSGRTSRTPPTASPSQRDVLWAGLTEEPELIDNINSRPADPASADGYTLVLVHCWTKSLANVQTVVDGLAPHVEVVTPRAFVRLIDDNHAL
ncbi:hypothetical protein FE633_08235 [Streptomyces montanus]|uniref:GxGYxYP putative glycoside hydrolase C-terminal domain-containing protein n=1 Tax=Streptomyces montanus TaxID=2580423 RepID=A0A5R9FTH4_9ACTN|nr:hypothetical protein [Streptomyces montanus]TLS46671.1 hypothetical protein FE633_08235 [Streptomyces montanus]